MTKTNTIYFVQVSNIILDYLMNTENYETYWYIKRSPIKYKKEYR